MQGKADKTFLDVSENIVAFEIKIKLLIHRMESGKIAAFLVLNAFAEEVEIWREVGVSSQSFSSDTLQGISSE